MLNILKRGEKVFAPASGKLVNLHDVEDDVFSQELMGPGLAIMLSSADVEIFAPVSGVIEAVYPTGHAVGIRTKKGTDILLHVGLESFNKKGLIKKYVKQGDMVKRGQVLLAINSEIAESQDRILLMTFPNLSATLNNLQSRGDVQACITPLYIVNN